MPERIQMTRQRPWRHEHPNAVIVARPSKWGNPWALIPDGRFMRERTYRVAYKDLYSPGWQPVPARFDGGGMLAGDARQIAADLFREQSAPMLNVTPLTGRDLACWCTLDQPCHGDVLLELANGTGGAGSPDDGGDLG